MTQRAAPTPRQNADALVRQFTLAAMATGAVPVPGASAALHAIVAAEVAAITHTMGAPFDATFVFLQLTRFGLSVAFTTLFVEGARLMGWFAGPLGVLGVSIFGASTAGVEAFVVGHLTIALCENPQLGASEAEELGKQARKRFHEQDWT